MSQLFEMNHYSVPPVPPGYLAYDYKTPKYTSPTTCPSSSYYSSYGQSYYSDYPSYYVSPPKYVRRHSRKSSSSSTQLKKPSSSHVGDSSPKYNAIPPQGGYRVSQWGYSSDMLSLVERCISETKSALSASALALKNSAIHRRGRGRRRNDAYWSAYNKSNDRVRYNG